MKTKKDRSEVKSSFGNLVNALYESLPKKIRNTPKGTALVCLALADMRERRVLFTRGLRPAV